MPGRRIPERPRSIAQAEHLKGAFLGGLSGETSIPAPINHVEISVQQAQDRVVLFARDEFIIAEHIPPRPEGEKPGDVPLDMYYPIAHINMPGGGYHHAGFTPSHRPIFGSELVHYHHRDGRVQQLSYHQYHWYNEENPGHERDTRSGFGVGGWSRISGHPDHLNDFFIDIGYYKIVPGVNVGDIVVAQYAYYDPPDLSPGSGVGARDAFDPYNP